MPTQPGYAPNVENQTVDFGGATWKGQPGSGWTLQRVNPEATNYSSTPGKGDINPETGKAYAINPETGVWDDNYWTNKVEPQLNAANVDGGSGAGSMGFTQPTIDLPKLYEGLYASSGVTDIERQLSDKTNQYNAAVSGIKDNPYLSEGTMTGRISKLTDRFSADSANIKNDIAMRKADIETKLNLETKQFDINSQQAQQAFSQFQSLLSAGALDNASGQDIANLTRSTGLSSSMIQSAIGVSKAKNAPKVNTQVISFDDGDNAGYAVINSDTGAIINKQIVAASKPSAVEQKAITNGTTGGTEKKQTATQIKQEALAQLPKDFNNKMTLGTAMGFYQKYGLSAQQIYDIYKRVNYYKATPAQQTADKKKYGVK